MLYKGHENELQDSYEWYEKYDHNLVRIDQTRAAQNGDVWFWF